MKHLFKQLLFLTILTMPFYCSPQIASSILSKINESNVAQGPREIVPLLTISEAKKLEQFLKHNLAQAETDEEQEYYEYLLTSFYKGMYDSVVTQINALGENIQNILNITGLRENLLLGKLNQTSWFIQEIAALPTQDYPSYRDKLIYLESLLDAFRRAAPLENREQALQALNELKKELLDCKEHITGLFAQRLVRDLNDLADLLQLHQDKKRKKRKSV